MPLMNTSNSLSLLSLAAIFLFACGAADTRVAKNSTPTLAEGEGLLALHLKTSQGVRIFLKDRTTDKKMFLYTPLGQEEFFVHKLPQGKYCLDKIDWLEKALNGVPPSMRLRRKHECAQVVAGKLSYGGHWNVTLSTVSEMRVTSSLDMDDVKARLAKNYAGLAEQFELFVPENSEWTFDFVNRN